MEPIDDRPYGIRDYGVRDLHGYHLSFGHPLFSSGPPIKIERVDVPVRLEKRLAALLGDLAEHKRMSVNSCLEEMLLHTNDGVGPHTQTTLRHIQELKKKHRIDTTRTAATGLLKSNQDADKTYCCKIPLLNNHQQLQCICLRWLRLT